MNVTNFDIAGPALLTLRRFADDRGFFTERFRADQWHAAFPAHQGFIQDNYSWSKPNVMRGLHYQVNPDQGKLVTCVQGTIVDVAVDIRPTSPTFGRNILVELSAHEPSWFWIPSGFAHGFVVTSPEGAGVLYKVDQPYSPKTEGAIRWDDPELAIPWPVQAPILSDKDQAAPSFREYLASKT
jgi:dTDP-4-dehydrorhamnose 3,5-epimerase